MVNPLFSTTQNILNLSPSLNKKKVLLIKGSLSYSLGPKDLPLLALLPSLPLFMVRCFVFPLGKLEVLELSQVSIFQFNEVWFGVSYCRAVSKLEQEWKDLVPLFTDLWAD